MKVVNGLATLLLLVGFFSCKKRYIERFDNGKIQLECEVKDKKKHGKCIKYYPSGIIQEVSHWKEGRLNGIREKFDSAGKLTVRTQFIDGVIDGTGEFYSGDTLLSRYQYEDDKPHGEYFEYYPNGEIKEKGFFEKGEAIGPHHYYDSDGNLTSKREYVIINGKSYFNQYWSYGEDGKIKMDQSNFIEVDESSEGIKIKLVAPLFGNESYLVISELDSGSKELPMPNFEMTLPYDQIQVDTLRGYVEDRKTEKSGDSTLIKRRKIYFEIPNPDPS